MGEDKVEGVKLEDGTDIPAGIVVMAVGIRPSTALAKESRHRGQSRHPGQRPVADQRSLIFSRSANAPSIARSVYGLVAPLYEMARTVAQNAGWRCGRCLWGSVTSTKLKVTGIDLYSGGDFAEGQGPRGDRAPRCRARRLQAPRHPRQPHDRRRHVWRDRRWSVVLRYAEEGRGHFRRCAKC